MNTSLPEASQSLSLLQRVSTNAPASDMRDAKSYSGNGDWLASGSEHSALVIDAWRANGKSFSLTEEEVEFPW